MPVFRYALENWPADTIEVAVFLPTAASEEQRALLDHVKSLQQFQGGTVNGNLWEFETGAEMPDWAKEMWTKESTKANGQPWVVLVDNNGRRGPRILDQGPLTSATIASMFDSPARRQAVSAILSGKAWSWIIVSADPAARQELEGKITAAMETVRKNTELPSAEEMLNDPARPNRPMSPLPLNLETGVFFIDPADAREKGLLAQMNYDPATEAAGPALYAVFGQGRVIGPLVGKELASESLTDLAFFLAGPCACQIKEMNPGFDVIVAADWGAVIDKPGSVERVGLEKDAVLFPPKAADEKNAPSAVGPENTKTAFAREAIVGTMLGGLIVVLLALAIIRRRQPPGK